ncbi:MAG: SDR family oxidoreductase [Gammaproteobacteria bacterium]|nr:SDR family oxidoreductase [Gammaproteobacteria bacterium]
MQSFNDKTVIVTGGTRGLGRGIAERFLSAGANVLICGRNEPKSLPETGGREALFVAADVRDAESSQALVDHALGATGRLDVLINNAGGSPEVAAADAKPRFTDAIIRLNLIAPLVLSQQAYSAMRENGGGGSIINIASVSAIRPSPGTAAYGAAKAGLVNATRSLAQEWAPDVRVNVIIAGLAKTEAAESHYGGAEGIHKIEQRMPMQRMATPADIGDACLYLASDDAAYVSGATLEVHGGGEPPAFLSLQRDD